MEALIFVSLVLIRLLQVFDSFELCQKEDAPPGSYPHESWQNTSGRKSMERIWPRAAVALFAQVRFTLSERLRPDYGYALLSGRFMDQTTPYFVNDTHFCHHWYKYTSFITCLGTYLDGRTACLIHQLNYILCNQHHSLLALGQDSHFIRSRSMELHERLKEN